MASQGFNGTGYGASQTSGVANTYINKWNEAQSSTEQAVRGLNEQERQENIDNQNDRFESVTTMISQATNNDQMNELLSEYGYGQIDENSGEFVWSEKPEGMSADDWAQMRYYYKLQKDNFDESGDFGQSQFTLGDSQFMYQDNKGNWNYMTNGEDMKTEMNNLRAGIITGSIQNNSYIHMENEKGEKNIYAKYVKGKLYYISKEEYERNSNGYNKWLIKGFNSPTKE